MSAPASRAYRFAPLDRAGWLLGLDASQCLAIGAGVVASGVLLQHGHAAAVVIVPAAVGCLYAFAIVGVRPLRSLAPSAGRFAANLFMGRTHWTSPVPLLTGTQRDAEQPPRLPRFLNGLYLVDASAEGAGTVALGGVGVVIDKRDRTASASVRVRGREFSLLERAEQERLVHLWGDALAGFCAERSAVSSVRVTEWAAPSGLAEQERHLAVAGARSEGSDAYTAYQELLVVAGPGATSHETLITVTVSCRRLRQRGTPGRTALERAVEVLLDEVRLLTSRLEAAGLTVDGALSAVDTAEVLRVRCDSQVIGAVESRRRSLAALSGVVSRYNAGPLATRARWSSLRVDGSLHRTYWVAEWPRLEVGPNWMEPLLLHAGAVRTVAIHYEPVPPTRALRRVDRDATRLSADEEQRTRSGFRVGARHRRAEEAVLEREAELVAGYAELEFAGFVTVSAPDEAALVDACAEYEQAAAQSGLELRALDGQQDTAFICSLPVGRGLAPRRWM